MDSKKIAENRDIYFHDNREREKQFLERGNFDVRQKKEKSLSHVGSEADEQFDCVLLSPSGSCVQWGVVFLVFDVEVGLVSYQTSDTVTVTWEGRGKREVVMLSRVCS